MKRLLTVFFSVVFLCSCIQAKAQNDMATPYFNKEEMPDLIKCLPPPPDSMGIGFGYDVMRYMWGKAQRNDSVRASIAYRDAMWVNDSMYAEFNKPFGLEISKEGTPEIYRLLDNSISTIRLAYRHPKDYYHRRRPFDMFHESMLTSYEETYLVDDGSYPSGHTLHGYTTALLLSEINPDNADTIMKPYFYPDIPRDRLFELGYIAEKSGHTRGSTVDLTLFDMSTEKEVDMGGTFDWFGIESHPDFGGDPDKGRYKANSKITEEQFKNRMILRKAMLSHGFKPVDTEWWHFTLEDEPFPNTYFNFPVKQ